MALCVWLPLQSLQPLPSLQKYPAKRGCSVGTKQKLAVGRAQRGLKFPRFGRGTVSSNVDVLGAHFYSIALLGAVPSRGSALFVFPLAASPTAASDTREPRVP